VSGLSVLKNPLLDMTPIRAVFDRCLAPGEFGQMRPVGGLKMTAVSRRARPAGGSRETAITGGFRYCQPHRTQHLRASGNART
jgi:hypothetical protein